MRHFCFLRQDEEGRMTLFFKNVNVIKDKDFGYSLDLSWLGGMITKCNV